MYDLYVSHAIGSISRPYFKAFMLGLIDVYSHDIGQEWSNYILAPIVLNFARYRMEIG